ncbi:TIGR03617 family F420-dependent LLM class oxidoreductase [Streptomyces sp. NBC_00656]|uniref:TIGR03617 family F420-dependent LLM class oxidoreductase n=1 Tax=Streptomyces sp. NBC_00656 TaxID=2903668 RepID=UPI00324C105A
MTRTGPPPETPHALKIDVTVGKRPEETASAAARAEERGADGVLVGETNHDPFMRLALAAGRTSRIELGTGVAIAFARTPMTLAHSAFDLQRLSGGRAVIGLGSQIKPHITKRYSMPWSRPAARMREYACAVRAIWHSWQTGDQLDFRGDFYTHTLMTPVFAPEALPQGTPPLWLAGVGPLMIEVAGRVGDGLICHPLTSVDYLRQAILPTVRAARARAEADGSDWTNRPFDVVGTPMVATGRTEEEFAEAIRATRERIAFYASTPAYLPVLRLHGWEALHEELNPLSREGRWREMGLLVDDDVLNAFAVVGEPATAGRVLRERFGGLLTRATIGMVHEAPADLVFDVLDGARG